MRYKDITTGDANRLKVWLQTRRLDDAVAMVDSPGAGLVLDYGSGNGELCRRLVPLRDGKPTVCYEPTPYLMAEARENLADVEGIEFRSTLEDFPRGTVDLLFCLEVLEHMPESPTDSVLADIDALLAPGGTAVVGVPVELGLPALYKGLFRMTRRFGQFDAAPFNILRTTFYMPPRERPVEDIAPGLPYHFHHTGFDHRRLRRRLARTFRERCVIASPFPALGAWANPEVYYLLGKR